MSRPFRSLTVLFGLTLLSVRAAGAAARSAADYARHFSALGRLSIAVAEAMPPGQYTFRPDPGSMSFARVVSHIAATKYQFRAGLKDVDPPALARTRQQERHCQIPEKLVRILFFVISDLTDGNSPDGRMPGREVLLATWVHLADHRGPAEIYLRHKGIAPTSYQF